MPQLEGVGEKGGVLLQEKVSRGELVPSLAWAADPGGVEAAGQVRGEVGWVWEDGAQRWKAEDR